jgi:hypothetical protein
MERERKRKKHTHEKNEERDDVSKREVKNKVMRVRRKWQQRETGRREEEGWIIMRYCQKCIELPINLLNTGLFFLLLSL